MKERLVNAMGDEEEARGRDARGMKEPCEQTLRKARQAIAPVTVKHPTRQNERRLEARITSWYIGALKSYRR